nr:capsid protein [Water buffalo astrovirus]
MPRNRNGRQNRNTTQVVVRSTSGSQQASTPRQRRSRRPTVNVNVNTRSQQQSPHSQRRSRPRSNAQNVQLRTNRRVYHRQAARQHEIHQRITTTLGTVGSNSSGGVENELTIIINPSTMKEQTGSTSFGPLNILAAQYAMWRVNRIQVRLKQLIGNNAASGTVARVSSVPNTNASQVSWSSLGARSHADVDIGKNGQFTITARDLRGPKDGWYYTNTTMDACDSCAGIIQIHTLGQTMNPYQNQPYTGPLFLAEVTTDWSFKDYQQNPGMLRMSKSETSQNADIEVDPTTNKIHMKVSNTTRLGTLGSHPSAADVIWMITDTVITSGADIFPPPFNWLFKGGWWLVKRAANAPVNGDVNAVYYDVYASVADAQNNKPIYASSATSSVPLRTVDYQQITPANLGLEGEILMSRSVESGSTEIVVTKMEALYATSDTYSPSMPMFIMKQNTPGPTQGIAVGNDTKKIYTWNLHKVQVMGDLPASGPPVYMTDSTTQTIGYVVAVNSVYLQGNGPNGSNAPKDFRLTSVLFRATVNRKYTFNDTFVEGYYSFNRNNPTFTTGSNTFNNVRLVVQTDGVYLAQFICVGGTRDSVTVLGTQVYTPIDGWNTTPHTYTIPPTSGNVNSGLPVGYSGALVFNPTQFRSTDGEFFDASEEQFTDNEALYFDEPPVEVIQVEPEMEGMYNMLMANGATDRQARLAVNQIKPSKSYQDFVATYHDSLVDGFSPAQARAAALGELPEDY